MEEGGDVDVEELARVQGCEVPAGHPLLPRLSPLALSAPPPGASLVSLLSSPCRGLHCAMMHCARRTHPACNLLTPPLPCTYTYKYCILIHTHTYTLMNIHA